MQPDNLGQSNYDPAQMPAVNNQVPLTAAQMQPAKPMMLIISLAVCVILLIGSLGFGIWALSGMQKYKSSSDKAVTAAVVSAEKDQKLKDEAAFADKEKSPVKTYTTPSTAGTIAISYPKSWSAFVTESEKSATPVDAYFHPEFVPGMQSGTSYALRLRVLNQTYDQVMKQFESSAKSGKAKITAFRPAKVQSVLGSRIDGDIEAGQKGIMIIVPLRDKTIQLFTESATFSGDFNNFVLPSFTFLP